MAEKEQYRLEALVGIRERTKEEKERELGAALELLRLEQERLDSLRAELLAMQDDRKQRSRDYSEKQMRGEMSAQEVISANDYIRRMMEKEERQRETIAAQVDVVEDRRVDSERAREALVVANQELKALEKHREKWEDDRKRERQRREEQIADDHAQTIYRRQQKG